MGNTVTCAPCCWASSRAVRVVNTNGKVLIYSAELLRADEVLRAYPHHYLAEAGQEKIASRESMLRAEEVLKPNTTYLLLPLPRLFTVRSSKPAPRPRVSYCCLRIAGGESDCMTLSRLLNDNYDVGGLSFRMGTERSVTEQTNYSHSQPDWSPTALPIGVQELLHSAEIEYKEIVEYSKSWRPHLESITEEKSPLHQPQTLAALLRGEEHGGERG